MILYLRRAKTIVRKSLSVAAVTMVCALATPAHSHPHVWIDAIAQMLFNDSGKLTGLRVYWAFDELYSAYAVEGLDTSGNGELERAELAPLITENIKNLKDFRYFTCGSGRTEPGLRGGDGIRRALRQRSAGHVVRGAVGRTRRPAEGRSRLCHV